MKILHISTGVQKIPPDRAGSPEGHIFFMSKHLVKLGHEVTIVDRKYSPSDPSLEQVDGVNIVRLSPKYFSPTVLEREFPFLYWVRSGLNTALFTFSTSKYLKKAGQFEVMNTHVISATFLLLLLNKRLKEKILYTHHAAFWPSQSRGILNRILLLLGRFTVKQMKRTIVLTDSVKSQFITRLKLPEPKFVTLPLGIDMNLFPLDTEVDDVRAQYQLNGMELILFVGRINQVKGLEYLVRAANIVVNQYNYKGALFLLAGPFESVELDKPGEYTAKIFNLIKSFKLEQNVKLTGTIPLDDVRKLYLACYMFVLPSIVEQFPLVVIEAMVSGKPVVAARTPGALMQIRDGWNGFSVEIGNEKELAEKIRYLLDKPEEARRMGTNARKFAKEFDWSIIAKKYLEVYATGLKREGTMKGQKGVKRWRIAQKAEKEGWQNWKSLKSDSMSKQLNKYWGWYIDLIAKYISFRPESKILDIGCGPDGIISHIPVGQRFGLDPLMDFYLSYFELPPDIEWETGNVEDIPFDSDYFDVVITTNTLDHSLEPEKGLKEIHRVLKLGGSLVLTVNCYGPLRRLVRAAREKVGLHDKPHLYNFLQRQVKAMIKEAGFTLLVHHKGVGTMGEWFYDRPPLTVRLVRKVVNIVSWLESKMFGYSCVDFIFIAQKS